MSEKYEKSNAASAGVQPMILSREFDAPRELMWKAWTESDRLVQWFGPKGMPMTRSDNDFRVGGRYHYCLRTPDGGTMWGRWVYREIAEPERLVFVSSFSDAEGGVTRAPFFDGNWPLEILSTVTFGERAGKTTVTVQWEPINATEIERETFDKARASVNGGWSGTFEQLADYLATGSRAISTTRLFDAPRDLVWKAWTDPKHIAQWWGPNGFSNTIESMDVRAGGVFRFVMHGPDGRDYPNEITYVEVVRPERLVYDHGPVPKFRVTVTFKEVGDKTEIAMSMLFDTVAERDGVAKAYGAVEGLQQTLGRLDGHLVTMKSASS